MNSTNWTLSTHLQRQQQQKCFNAVEASVHKVAKKQVVLVRAVAPHFEQLHKVIELAMDVSTDRDWSIHSLHIRLVY